MIRDVRALIAYPLAVLAGFLPKRYWEDIDLPIQNVFLFSSLLNFFAGAAIGVTGFFAYMEYVLAQRQWTAPPFMIYVYISYLFLTPRGLFSMYLVLTGFFRYGAWHIKEPHGDPILEGIDALWRRLRSNARARTERDARLALEKIDEPDRRYDGEWAGLPDVTYVVVAARRKPGWTKGTWVITNDGWFTLGEPFDRPMPNGLRTVYPLTLQTSTLDVLRKGVSYELPPLRKTPVNSANRLRQGSGGHEGGHHPQARETTQAREES